ncbi:MAG: Glycerol dehydrogenase [Anaerosporomusa subterranea]|jgi:glycerol dehydrogenase|nr:Glycerol dehydrogenase [Anaerosporomusa subterranea]
MSIDRLPFPAKVFRGSDAIRLHLGAACKPSGTKGFVIGGKTALSKTQENIFASLKESGVQTIAVEWYGGEVTRENISKLAKQAVEQSADFILAVGGGKALDTGKAVAAECRLPIITVPTIAATCAAATPLTVQYNVKGEFTGNLFLEDCPAAIVIDTEVILGAPAMWLIAGMGDTLAKMYELRAAAVRLPANSITISAVSNGQICYNIIQRFGGEARKSVERKTLSSEFASVVDAIILLAGLSSIFGGDTLRNAAAHAIYNGLTKIPATHQVAHGSIVGYGNLCLLALEDRSDAELIDEIKLTACCGIPTMISQIADLSADELAIAAQAAVEAKAMSCMPFAVSAEMVIKAMRRVDKLAAACLV